MSSFAILRIQKLKSDIAIQRSLKHSFREQTTPNADPERTHLNSHYKANNVESALANYSQILGTLTKKVRTNAVKAVEFLITASPEVMQEKDKSEQMSYFRDALTFLKDKHGEENIVCAGVHFDETTPHMYVYVVPIDEKKHLNCRKFYGESDALSHLQTDFAINVGAKHGLDRGIQGSKAEHQSLKKYYAKVNQRLDEKTLLDAQTLTIKFKDLKDKHTQTLAQIEVVAQLCQDNADLFLGLSVSSNPNELKAKINDIVIDSVWDEAMAMNMAFEAEAKAKAKAAKAAKIQKTEAALKTRQKAYLDDLKAYPAFKAEAAYRKWTEEKIPTTEADFIEIKQIKELALRPVNPPTREIEDLSSLVFQAYKTPSIRGMNLSRDIITAIETEYQSYISEPNFKSLGMAYQLKSSPIFSVLFYRKALDNTDGLYGNVHAYLREHRQDRQKYTNEYISRIQDPKAEPKPERSSNENDSGPRP